MKSAVELLPVGSYFYFRIDSLYYLFQLLEVSEEHLLVQRFWSSTTIPSMEKLHQFDVKSACSELEEEATDFTVIGQTGITADQEKEIFQFLRIKAGKTAREREFLDLKKEALEAFEKEAYEEAVRLFSLAAPYSKYDIELYEKRGLSYLKLARYSDALADFDYYLIHNPGNELIAEAAKLAKQKRTNT